MKNFLSKILLVVMMLVLALSVVGCKKNKDKNKESTKEPTSQVESTPESLPEVVPPVDTHPVQPVEGVDVSVLLDLFNPVLGNEYATIEFSMAMDLASGNFQTNMVADVVAHVKNTDKGYDLIATVEMEQSVDEEGEEYDYEESITVKVLYVDGMLVLGQAYDGEDMEYVKSEVGNVNDLLTMVNTMIASDPEMKDAYTQAMPAIEELLAVLDEADLTRVTIDKTIDVKAIAEEIIAYISANEETDLYTWILRDILGINPTDTAKVTALENEILAIGANDPTMAQVLDRVVALLNSKLPQDAQINLKEIIDAIQAEIGITTAEVVEMLNHEMFCEEVWDDELQDVVEVCHEELFLPAPEAGVTIYDYFYTLINTIKLNDLLGEQFASFQELCEFLKGGLQATTFGQLFDSVMGNITHRHFDYEYVGEGNGDTIWNEYGYQYVGAGNGDYLEMEIDYMAEFKEFVATLDIEKIDVVLGYDHDNYGRPTELNVKVDFDVTAFDDRATQVIDVEVKFTYTKPDVEFVISADILANAGDLSEMMGGSAEKQPY
ncbi:MAG: hypothetical protein IKA99_00410 [Clostridia bacterium]|nr:hypothetical protein [Clostridia bacterium]